MTVLNTLAIVLGVLAVAKSLTAAIWPKGYRDFSKKMLESDVILRVLAVVPILIGGIIVVAVLKGRTWLEVVLVALAIVYLPLGAMLIWNPDSYRQLATKLLHSGDLTFRALCGVGVLIGILLFLLGIFG